MTPRRAGPPVWDLPIRLFHLALILILPAAWWAAESDRLDLHRIVGAVVLALMVFRLSWGLIGSSTARFRHFLAGPAGVMRYLRGQWSERPGHTPLGGWSVAALLLTLTTQVFLGLFAIDEDSIVSGPLAKFVSFETARAAAHWHHRCFNVLLGLIALHLGAIVFYALRGKRLVPAMITGGEGDEPVAPVWRALVCLALGAGSAAVLFLMV